MKKTVNAGIGGKNFTLDEDAYARLEAYLNQYHNRLKNVSEKEKMADLESRISELFAEKEGDGKKIMDVDLVNSIIEQLGMPEGGEARTSAAADAEGPVHKIYRDPSDSRIAGVCSGMAVYFDIDVVLMRVIALVTLFLGTAGFWIYVILWIVVPKAETAEQQCELHGVAQTAENLAKYSPKKKK